MGEVSLPSAASAANDAKGGELTSPQPPRILSPWVHLYRSVPKIYLPRTNLDISFSLVSCLALICIRLLVMRTLRASGWPYGSKMTTDAAASLTSVIHSLLLLPGVGACLFCCPSVPYVPSAKLDDAASWYQDAVSALLSLCTGYMLFDSVFLYVDAVALNHHWTDFEWLILGHHVATVLYMSSCRYVRAGHISTMILIFAGECTNPLMNAMFTTRFASQIFRENAAMHALHAWCEFSYACSYAPIRIIIGPACAAHLSWDLLLTARGRKNVPAGLSLVWVVLCWAVIAGSLPWMEEAVGMIRDGLAVKFHADYDYGDRYRLSGGEL